ncbi:N-acetyl-gamma-glutamyl-phosphate reductase [Catenovulum sp. SM1970]|uniref:N-acetyl-gamma-glutamyl-phosphate reductase n=1 Tax=Marinifaba aquimaris TaxID=2741323 RepID=UPI001572DC4E|nr:N-acetyl-gamma-glutamyl-phosphate reductase [Marinifaba aquimaris]NTS77058.1 N-acetyl-gamma-glutamyl-phosphate reductase [Marinifaba aquimaris]
MTDKFKIFIDGEAGTTGLQIRDRLKSHPHVEVISIDHDKRKDVEEKKAILAQADICILCLPDAAAIETVKLAQGLDVRFIDASTAHRIADGWVYGLAELSEEQRDLIAQAKYVSNPGCYPTGANLLLKPLIYSGLLKADARININAVSGYSGGGNALIDAYEGEQTPSAYALYGLNFNHKHLPEIVKWTGLEHTPNFFPSVVNLKQGMVIQIPLSNDDVKGSASDLAMVLADYYKEQTYVRVHSAEEVLSETFFNVEGNANTNYCDLAVLSSDNDDRHLLVARLDNLGKGASGACVQNMNIMLGLEESICVDLT